MSSAKYKFTLIHSSPGQPGTRASTLALGVLEKWKVAVPGRNYEVDTDSDYQPGSMSENYESKKDYLTAEIFFNSDESATVESDLKNFGSKSNSNLDITRMNDS